MAFLERVGGKLERLGQRLAGKPASAAGTFHGSHSGTGVDRLAQYRLWEMLYNNEVYLPQFRGGRLEDVLQGELGKGESCKGLQLPGYFYPFPRIVDAYQRLIPGTYDNGYKVAATVNGRPVNARLVDPKTAPIRRICRDSNFDIRKSELLYMGPNFGTTGWRACYQPAPDPVDRRVFLEPIDPATIHSFVEDLRGNLLSIRLESEWTDPETGRSRKVVEVLTKTTFSKTIDGEEQLPPAERVNVLGHVPVKLIRHKRKRPSQAWGDNAYRGLERPAMAINFSMANILRSADQYAFAQLFMAGEGDAPDRVVLGNNVVLYVKLSKDGPEPKVELLVPDIDFAGVLAVIQDAKQDVRDAYPEMALTEYKLLAGQSGESKRQSALAIESRVGSIRPNYVAPWVAINKLAMSIGIINSMWDVGTGMGTREAADRAFRGGLLDHEFELDPVVAETPEDKIANVAAETARRTADLRDANAARDLVSHDESLRIAGYDQADIDRIQGERALDDVQRALAQPAGGASGQE